MISYLHFHRNKLLSKLVVNSLRNLYQRLLLLIIKLRFEKHHSTDKTEYKLQFLFILDVFSFYRKLKSYCGVVTRILHFISSMLFYKPIVRNLSRLSFLCPSAVHGTYPLENSPIRWNHKQTSLRLQYSGNLSLLCNASCVKQPLYCSIVE